MRLKVKRNASLLLNLRKCKVVSRFDTCSNFRNQRLLVSVLSQLMHTNASKEYSDPGTVPAKISISSYSIHFETCTSNYKLHISPESLTDILSKPRLIQHLPPIQSRDEQLLQSKT